VRRLGSSRPLRLSRWPRLYGTAHTPPEPSLRKDQSPQRLARIVLELVQNVLDSGDEDMWLSFNGEQLILIRRR
jgi:hypothetical protein